MNSHHDDDVEQPRLQPQHQQPPSDLDPEDRQIVPKIGDCKESMVKSRVQNDEEDPLGDPLSPVPDPSSANGDSVTASDVKREAKEPEHSFMSTKKIKLNSSVEEIDKSLIACQIKVEDEEDNQCSLCGHPFAGQIQLMRHLANTHFKTEFPCSVCALSFMTEEHLDLHHHKVHQEIWTPHQEMTVGLSESVVIKQEVRNDEYYDEENNYVEPSSPDWTDTVNEVPFKNVSNVSNVEVELSCFKCDPPVEFVTHDELKTHLEEKHPETIIECVYCKKMVHSKEFASHHMLEVMDVDGIKYKCNICRQSFAAGQHCTMHIQNKHMDGAGFCSVCDLYFRDYRSHKSTEHERPKCKICDKEFTTSKYLTRHMAAHRKIKKPAEKRIPEGPGLCFECGEQCEDLAKHTEEKHKELFDAMEKKPIKKVPIEEIPKGPGVCEVCDKHVDNLNLHMCDEHKTLGYWKCESCDQMFDSREKRKAHNLANHRKGEDRSGICEECGKFDENVQKHIFLTHQVDNEGPGRCTYCHLEVPNLKLHLADVHASKLYVNCKKCDKPILGQKMMKIHLKISHGEGPVLCNVCGRVFPTNKALSQHMRYGHSLHCFDCGASFRKAGMMAYHRYKVHGIEGNLDAITCKECKKMFSSEDQMKRHLLKVHGPGKKCPCPICGKVMADSATVTRHIKTTHDRVREYICPVCGKALMTNQRLITHGRIVHGIKIVRQGKKGGPTSYVCDDAPV